jgi:hypothetical protein
MMNLCQGDRRKIYPGNLLRKLSKSRVSYVDMTKFGQIFRVYDLGGFGRIGASLDDSEK